MYGGHVTDQMDRRTMYFAL